MDRPAVVDAARITGLRGTVVTIGALHLLGLALLVWGSEVGTAGVLTLGMAGTVYLLGLRHAVDADHIAMIDNSTRRFLGLGRRHASVGLAFSAGHSTVVIGAGLAVVLGAGWLRRALQEESSLALVLGVIGASVSALYLLAVAAANLPQAVGAWRTLRDGGPTTAPGGPVSRALSAPMSRVTRPRHVYAFGLLFGLGFDTASTISLLMLTGAGAVAGVGAPVALMALPVLFAAAMTLGDTANGLVMLRMYSAAVSDRSRAWFNLALTVVSVTAAVVIALVTLSGLLVGDLGLGLPGLSSVALLDTEWWGVGLIALLLAVGLVAVLVHGRARYRH